MLAQRKMTNIDSASVWGASRRDAICDPFWEDLERSTRYKAKYQIATSTWEGRLFAEVEKFFAYGAAVLRALFDWLRKLLASGFSPLLKCFAEAFSVVGGIFARARRLFFPAKVGGGSAAGGTFRKKQRAFASLMELARQHAPGIKERLREQVRSPEFWLGVVFGATTRITTKFAIVAAFATTPGLVTLAGFVACATAGVAAGAVTHLVRTGYRNSKAAPGKGKEKYTGKALFESAAIGLFGGMLGGYVMNAGAVLARAGSVAIGVGAGVAAGVLHASVNGFRAAARGQKAEMAWGRMAFQGAAFGALGGILGVVSVDVLSPHESIAASVGEAGSVTYVQPSPYGYADYCDPSDPCAGPPPPPVAAPVHEVQPAPQPQEIERPVKKAIHRPVRHHARPHARRPVDTCRPAKKIVPKVRHLRHVRHLKNLKPAVPVVEKPFVIEHTVQPLTPPQVITPPPVMMPVDPCSMGDCRSPCEPMTYLDIKGPCADPNTPCVQKISYNDMGEATRAVLEPRTVDVPGPYIEVETPKVTKITNWNKAAQGTVLVAKATEGTAKVALVVPFVGQTMAQAVADVGLVPA